MLETQENLNANTPELARVAKLARSLPAVCRRAFTLRKVYGYSGKEIATRLGIPDEAVEELLIQAAQVCAQTDATDVRSLAQCPSLADDALATNR
jgi:RNA polymerase sigma-70 factor (ECF subfamily)